MRPVFRTIASAITVLLVTSACTTVASDAQPTSSVAKRQSGSATPTARDVPDTPGIAGLSGFQAAQVVLEAAEAGGAGDEQLEELGRAVESGKVTFEDAASAARRTVNCLQEVGASATYSESVMNGNYRVPGFTVGDVDSAIVDECEAEESFWVNYLYQTQPNARAAVEQAFEDAKPTLIACLEQHGTVVPEESTNDELLYMALRLWEESQSTDVDTPVNCLDEAGIQSY